MFRQSNTKALYGGADSLPLMIYENHGLYAVVCVQGAQILEYRVKGQDLLWLSPKAIFEGGKSIRGGIPVCAPWFGVHPDPAKPKHGFVRNDLWDIAEQGANSLTFMYTHAGDDVFPHPFHLRYRMVFEDVLQLTLEIENTGDQNMPFSWAFHSYHPVPDLGAARVLGLEGLEYLDATDSFKRVRQEGAVVFKGEVDRVYEAVPERQIIQDHIEIKGEKCPTAIVWNPGAALADKMPDVGEHYHNFICVERGAAFGDALSLHAGEKILGHLVLRLKS